MTAGWIELKTLKDVAKAQADGWEIEFSEGSVWRIWAEDSWHMNHYYRARPAQPKMKKMKMLCYTNEITIDWKNESLEVDEDLWIRVPSQDIEIEIPEGV